MNNATRAGLAVAAIALIAAPWAASTLLIAKSQDAPNGSNGANKTQVAASSLEVMTTEVVDGATSDVVTLLSTTIKTSAPQDLVFQVTAECALWTDVQLTGNDDQSAVASVKVWIEFDGVSLAVSADEPAGDDYGKVTFCNRALRHVTTNVDDEDATFATYLRTRSANAFNWIEIDAGSQTHTVEVKCRLDAEATTGGMAKAAVGKRTLVVEPVHLDNGATL